MSSSAADSIARQLWDAFQKYGSAEGASSSDKGDVFCGLFIYDGVRREPPSEDDAIVQAMQTADDTWIVFADDSNVQQCADCVPPFVDCSSAEGEEGNEEQGASFCHLRFPLTARGTLDAVRFMVNDYVGDDSNATAFICAYSRSNILDEQSEPQAHVIARYVLGGDDHSKANEEDSRGTRDKHNRQDALADSDGMPTVADLSKTTPRKTFRRVWIVAIGLALLAAIVAIVTLLVLRAQKQKKQKALQKTREAALIEKSLQQQQYQEQQQEPGRNEPVVVRIAPQ